MLIKAMRVTMIFLLLQGSIGNSPLWPMVQAGKGITEMLLGSEDL